MLFCCTKWPRVIRVRHNNGGRVPLILSLPPGQRQVIESFSTASVGSQFITVSCISSAKYQNNACPEHIKSKHQKSIHHPVQAVALNMDGRF